MFLDTEVQSMPMAPWKALTAATRIYYGACLALYTTRELSITDEYCPHTNDIIMRLVSFCK